MATFRQRGNSIQVQIRLDGLPAESKSFKTKKEALAWARDRENELRAASKVAGGYDPKLGDIVEKYRLTVKGKKSYDTFYHWYLNQLAEHHISKLPSSRLKLLHFEQFKKIRLRKASAVTVKKQMYMYRAMLRTASESWGVKFPHIDIEKVHHKAKEAERVVRFEPVDIQSVLGYIWGRDKRVTEETKQLYEDCFLFSIETGLRRGELLKLKPKHYSRHFGTVDLKETKNGDDRIVALSPKAKSIIERRIASNPVYIFPVDKWALKSFFQRAFGKHFEGRRWHDTRHEALSSFFEKGLNLPEVKSQSGHRSIASLNRYVHAKVQTIVGKLAVAVES